MTRSTANVFVCLFIIDCLSAIEKIFTYLIHDHIGRTYGVVGTQ